VLGGEHESTGSGLVRPRGSEAGVDAPPHPLHQELERLALNRDKALDSQDLLLLGEAR